MTDKIKIWQNNASGDDGAVHSIGNGEMLIYSVGPNIINFYGPPYSSASFLKMNVQDELHVKSESTRVFGTAVWKHEIFREDFGIT